MKLMVDWKSPVQSADKSWHEAMWKDAYDTEDREVNQQLRIVNESDMIWHSPSVTITGGRMLKDMVQIMKLNTIS